MRGKKERHDVINYFDSVNPSIVCFQDTHLLKSDTENFTSVNGYEFFLSGSKTNARGVAILIKNNFEYKINNFCDDDSGNWQLLDLNISRFSVRILNIYAPNTDTPSFFNNLANFIENNEQDYVLICGDFNLVLDPILDCFNYKCINNPNSRGKVIEILQTYNLIDLFRYLNPTLKRFTWRRKNPIKQARLDYFIVSDTFVDIISGCKIKPGYRTDHSMLELNITVNTFQRGKGLWKFNCSLLKNQEYLSLINKLIEEVVQTYTVPVYNFNYISASNVLNLQFTIEDDLLLEMILLKARENTIRFSANLKKMENELETNLLKDIENIAYADPSPSTLELLETKNKELEKLRETKINGQMIRSRAQWLHSGEKLPNIFPLLNAGISLIKLSSVYPWKMEP